MNTQVTCADITEFRIRTLKGLDYKMFFIKADADGPTMNLQEATFEMLKDYIEDPYQDIGATAVELVRLGFGTEVVDRICETIISGAEKALFEPVESA